MILCLIMTLLAFWLTAPGASAAPGAIGGYDDYDLTCDLNWQFDQCSPDVSGWAYNAHTKPVQAVVLHFYNSAGTLVHVTDQYTANGWDDWVPTKYQNFAWQYGFWVVNKDWGHISTWRKVCAWAHDKGESGGYVSIGCRTLRLHFSY